MNSEVLKDLLQSALEEGKGQDIRVLDVRKLTSMTDWMVLVSGRSERHVRALARDVVEKGKEAGLKPLGLEGSEQSGWVLVDYDDVLVHVMVPPVRDFYNLEKLWDMSPADDEPAAVTQH